MGREGRKRARQVVAVAIDAQTSTQVVEAFLWTLSALIIVSPLISQSARKHVAPMAREANFKWIDEKGFEFEPSRKRACNLSRRTRSAT
jgi:hypothetical protein